MNILIVIPSYFPAVVYGGPTFSIHLICKEIVNNAVNIKVSTTNANGKERLNVESNKDILLEKNYIVRYYHDNIIGRFSASLVGSIYKDIVNSDIVHLQDIYSIYAIQTLIFCRFLKKPLLISPRGSFSKWGMKNKKHLLKIIWIKFVLAPFSRKASWHATSDSESQEIKFFFPKSKVYILPNGVDCDDFNDIKPYSRENYFKNFKNINNRGILDSNMLVVSMGRLHSIKGLEISIEAVSRLSKDIDLVYLIAGSDFGEKRKLDDLVKNYNMENRIFFVGELNKEEKYSFLKGADVFISPSHSENFGMSILESLAVGTPVIVSNKTPWASIDKKAGFCIENTVCKFESTIKYLHKNREMFSRSEVVKCAQPYCYNRLSDSYIKMYKRLNYDTL